MSTSCEGGDIDYNLKVDTSEAATNLAELNRLFTVYLAIARRTGLPDNIMDAMRMVQQLRLAAQATTTAINVMYTATGPVGWLIGGGGLILSGFMWTDWVMEVRSH